MSVEEDQKLTEDLGETLKTYYHLALALNSFQKGQEISIRELAERAKVHWSTAKKAMLFFELVKPVMPKFELSQDFKLKLVQKQDSFEAVEGIFSSLEMRILTKMMLCKATNLENARPLVEILNQKEIEILPQLISRGYINSTDGRYYLSRRGANMGSLGLKKLIETGIPLPWQTPIIVEYPICEDFKIISLLKERGTEIGVHQVWQSVPTGIDAEGWRLSTEESVYC
jgi:hypothetical protein